MSKKKNTDFYLLKKKSISEGDLFVTDYIKTKNRLNKISEDLEILKLQLDSIQNEKKKVVKLFDEE
jgi:hypothetical protein|tara:strand:+ start:74 stop:271 length:198 start_codon:yes stop_codon:yes gene_type:complete